MIDQQMVVRMLLSRKAVDCYVLPVLNRVNGKFIAPVLSSNSTLKDPVKINFFNNEKLFIFFSVSLLSTTN
jgi:hypothetical protein